MSRQNESRSPARRAEGPVARRAPPRPSDAAFIQAASVDGVRNVAPSAWPSTRDSVLLAAGLRRALIDAMVDASIVDRRLLELMALLRKEPSAELDAVLGNALETALGSEPSPEWADDALPAFQLRFPSVALKGLSWAQTKVRLGLSPRLINATPE